MVPEVQARAGFANSLPRAIGGDKLSRVGSFSRGTMRWADA